MFSYLQIQKKKNDNVTINNIWEYFNQNVFFFVFFFFSFFIVLS